ncbi:hypothetical protein WMY93_022199 [Mugilogobius chulae]|uniref:Transposase domain-containing protein n=1 Tax=Mugilogobius chulae TaxID=88201 RepID=A0AAW0NAR8_9GOBI
MGFAKQRRLERGAVPTLALPRPPSAKPPALLPKPTGEIGCQTDPVLNKHAFVQAILKPSRQSKVPERVQGVSEKCFHKHQARLLIPTMNWQWKLEQDQMIAEAVESGSVTLGGDMCADTPGICKKMDSIGKIKGMAVVGLWRKSVVNHLYWSATSPTSRQRHKAESNHYNNIVETQNKSPVASIFWKFFPDAGDGTQWYDHANMLAKSLERRGLISLPRIKSVLTGKERANLPHGAPGTSPRNSLSSPGQTEMNEKQTCLNVQPQVTSEQLDTPESIVECQQLENSDLDDSFAEVEPPLCSDSSTQSNDDEKEETNEDLLITRLRYWATSFSISLVALSALLSILKAFHPSLPKDGRTLLGTQSHVTTNQILGGEYYHFGLVKGIILRLKGLRLPDSIKSVSLQFNIDGLPLFKSSRLQFWPILAILDCDYTSSPFLVGIFCGLSKPKCVFEYLQPFVSELKKVLTSGIVHNGKQLQILVSSFVCDAPARAYVKNIKSHNGYSGCDKCNQEGVWRNKMTYPETNATLRTDDSYSNMTDEGHHLGQKLSPLTGIVKMVSMFPIDYMHLCCLGVTRKLLNMWIKGNLTTRLSSRTVNEISSKLLNLRSHTPRDFNRKPRGLNELDRWKATELRSFMLYWGPIVLRDSLPSELFDNFMMFSVAMFIFLSPKISSEIIEFAQTLMISFVEHFGQLYGRDEIVFSIHQLIHLAEEYKRFGPLDNVSGFPFENYLGQIKHLLRKPHQPLQQLVKRMSEMQHVELPIPTGKPVLQKIHCDGPLPVHFIDNPQYNKVSNSRFTLSTEPGDNCIVVGKEIALVQNVVQVRDEVYVVYRFFRQKEPYYTYPCDSSNFGIYKIGDLCENIGVGRLGCIKQKCVLYPQAGRLIAIPLLHLQV